MNARFHTRTQQLLAIVTLGLALGALAPAASAAAATRARVVATLLDDEGEPMAIDPRAVPKDPAAHTRNGLYATEAQGRLLQAALGDNMIAVRVGCCGYGAIDQAADAVGNAHASADMPGGIPVLVRGANLRQAARVVDRLTEIGLSRVWLVSVP